MNYSRNGGPLWDDDEWFLVRALAGYTPNTIVSALYATFESTSLAEIATELDELVRYLNRASSTAEPAF